MTIKTYCGHDEMPDNGYNEWAHSAHDKLPK